MTTLKPPLDGKYFPPPNEDDPYGLAALERNDAGSEPAPADLDALRRRVHGEQP